MIEPTSARILVVEDEMIVAKDIHNRLTSLGYHVVAVTTGKAAITAVKKGNIDLILMDIRLKGAMDGIQATQVIQRLSMVPIVYLTAYADKKTLQRAKVTNPYGYIMKPIIDAELRATIEIALHRVSTQKILQQNEKRFRNIFENVNDIIAFVDLKGIIQDVNAKVKTVFGFEPREIIGKNFIHLKIMDKAQLARLTTLFARMVAEKSTQDLIELEFHSKDGTTIFVEASATFTKDHAGRAGFLSIIRDITGRKKIEQALADEQQRSQTLTRKIIRAQEEERLFLASEIHDELL